MDRRKFLGQAGLGLATGAFLLPKPLWSAPILKGKDPFKGVAIGAISYSFRSMPSSADDILGYLAQTGLAHVELMGDPIEAFAGAPKGPGWRRDMTEEQKAEMKVWNEEMKKWRTSAGMDRFKALRKKYNDEGITIDVVKFPLDKMSDEEIAYAFKVAMTMGAKGITLERSDEAVKKLAPYADQYKAMIGYHNHAKVDFHSWDNALSYSKYNALNLDVGHYVAGTNESPIPLIQKYPDRILNLHLKDRKKNDGDNLPWGQGETPLREILLLMKKEKYKFMGTIELEYKIPEGSDAVKEVKKCADFCKDILA